MYAAPQSAGIYQLKHAKTGDTYIGAAVNLKQRISSHISQLRSGSHPSPKLLECFTPFDNETFLWGILETCRVSELGERERRWVKKCNPSLNVSATMHKSKQDFEVTIFARVPQELKDKIIEYQQQQQVIPQESEVIRDLLKRGLKDVGLL